MTRKDLGVLEIGPVLHLPLSSGYGEIQQGWYDKITALPDFVLCRLCTRMVHSRYFWRLTNGNYVSTCCFLLKKHELLIIKRGLQKNF